MGSANSSLVRSGRSCRTSSQRRLWLICHRCSTGNSSPGYVCMAGGNTSRGGVVSKESACKERSRQEKIRARSIGFMGSSRGCGRTLNLNVTLRPIRRVGSRLAELHFPIESVDYMGGSSADLYKICTFKFLLYNNMIGMAMKD